MSVSEHEHEPIRGLPEYLPEDETLLWQGEPDLWAMARRVFHLRGVAAYFTLLLCVHVGYGLYQGGNAVEILLGSSWMLGLGLLALGILAILARAYAKSTVYTLTDKRLVMRFGVAMPMMVNLPLAIVGSADMRRYPDGSGDIMLTLSQKKRLSYLMLWPNIRPWQFKPVVPAMRCVPEVDSVAQVLATAVSGDDSVLPTIIGDSPGDAHGSPVTRPAQASGLALGTS